MSVTSHCVARSHAEAVSPKCGRAVSDRTPESREYLEDELMPFIGLCQKNPDIGGMFYNVAFPRESQRVFCGFPKVMFLKPTFFSQEGGEAVD